MASDAPQYVSSPAEIPPTYYFGALLVGLPLAFWFVYVPPKERYVIARQAAHSHHDHHHAAPAAEEVAAEEVAAPAKEEEHAPTLVEKAKELVHHAVEKVEQVIAPAPKKVEVEIEEPEDFASAPVEVKSAVVTVVHGKEEEETFLVVEDPVEVDEDHRDANEE
jgi:hypothetical protein